MAEKTFDKSILLISRPEEQTIDMRFSDDLVDDREKGYILSAAFFAFAASQGLDKKDVLDMVAEQYDGFKKNIQEN
mgnify:CR=1 FL=1